jgi:hypothetical protein
MGQREPAHEDPIAAKPDPANLREPARSSHGVTVGIAIGKSLL